MLDNCRLQSYWKNGNQSEFPTQQSSGSFTRERKFGVEYEEIKCFDFLLRAK